MHIDQLTLKNFRNFESVDIPLNSKMNIVIGNNGSGKSSLLMGALTAASAFFLGIDYASPRSIKTDDVRHVAHEIKKVYQQVAVYPVEVSCEGVVNGVTCKWSRSLSGPKSNTTYGGAFDLRNIASPCKKAHQANIQRMYFRLLLIMALVDCGHKSKQRKRVNKS